MKEYAPIKCPVCGEMYDWKYVGSDKQGFSAGKAAVGAVAFGPLGLAAGPWARRSPPTIAASVVFRAPTM